MRSLTDIIVESFSKTHIFEMANSREKYIDLVRGLADQIVQNWCLVKYCNLYDEENIYRLHWSKELIAHIGKLQRQKLKGNVDKTRATRVALIDQEEMNDTSIVELAILSKFEDEGIEIDLSIISNEFIKRLDEIVYIISKGTPDELKEYVYKKI